MAQQIDIMEYNIIIPALLYSPTRSVSFAEELYGISQQYIPVMEVAPLFCVGQLFEQDASDKYYSGITVNFN